MTEEREKMPEVLSIKPKKDLFFLAEESVKQFQGRISPEVYQGILSQLNQETIPDKIVEQIDKFPPEKKPEALGMISAARAAYLVVQELSKTVKPSRPKEDRRQIYSLADEVSSEIIRNILTKQFPHYGYLDEEVKGQPQTQARCWIVDPVDGSAGIVRRLNSWAVGIALHEKTNVEKGGTGITLGVIASPQGNSTEVTFGGRELGTFDWAGDPVKTSLTEDSEDLSISVGSRDIRENKWIATLQAMGRLVSRVYSGIDTQHAGVWLTRGSIDLLARMEQPSYDVAPVIAIVEGAGGRVQELDGQAVVVQRDKVRRHQLVAWNGRPPVIEFLHHLRDYQMDVVTTSGTHGSGKSTLVETLRTGNRYNTAVLLPRAENKILLRIHDRFGTGTNELDFPICRITSPEDLAQRKKAQDKVNSQWFDEVNAKFQTFPQPLEEPDHRLLAQQAGISDNTRLKDTIGSGLSDHPVAKNPFLPEGGTNRESTRVGVVEVKKGFVPQGAEGHDLIWLDLDSLLERAGQTKYYQTMKVNQTPVSPRLLSFLQAWQKFSSRDFKPIDREHRVEKDGYRWFEERYD